MVEVLESLLRYFVRGTQRVDEPTVRALLQQTFTGEPIILDVRFGLRRWAHLLPAVAG